MYTPTPSTPTTIFGRHKLVTLTLLFILAITAGFLTWLMWSNGVELEEALFRSEREIQVLHNALETLRSQATSMRMAADSAELRAADAEVKSKRFNEARKRAELERELVRETAQHYRSESVQARQDAEQARIETNRIRQRREAELDRMQQALNLITATERTPVGMIINLGEDSFLFDFDKSTLRSENKEILSRIAGVLLVSHGFQIYVYGHTDDLGPAVYNNDLSIRRARAVRNYLVSSGVPESVIKTRGFGENSPARKSQSAIARQKNRRVEIGIIDTVIHYTEAIQN